MKVCEDKIMHNEASGKIRNEILLDLAEIVEKIETEYGCIVDIEFAIDCNDKI